MRDPGAIVAACREGLVPIRVVEAALDLASPPVAISARLLASAQRDLSTIVALPSLRAPARKASRIFRCHGALDPAWIARKRALLVELAEARRHAEAASRETEAPAALSPWLARALEIMRFVHGDDAAIVRAAFTRRTSRRSRGHRAHPHVGKTPRSSRAQIRTKKSVRCRSVLRPFDIHPTARPRLSEPRDGKATP